MVDLSDKAAGSESEDMNSGSPDRVSSSDGGGHVKTCADCGTTRTPLWRGGPAGPKSLCNACGIRSRKKRRALLDPSKDEKKPKRSGAAVAASPGNRSGTGSNDGSGNLGDTLKRKLVAFGREVVLQRPRSTLTKQRRRKLGEEEQAAMLLMALSCGSVFA